MRGHAVEKYRTGQRLRDVAEGSGLRVEVWQHKPGKLTDLRLEHTEIAVLLSGRARVKRTGDGVFQDTHARRGTAWVCGAGVDERDVELFGQLTEVLHIFLPPSLIEQCALQDYDIDPARARLAYAGGVNDPTIVQISFALRGLLEQPMQQTDRLFIDGMRNALAAHLLAQYPVDRWQSSATTPSLDSVRLKRVLDFIESELSSALALDDLAAQACLSPFHFSRVFRQTVGVTPHQYVTERRVQVAKERLTGRSSLLEISLDTGFGTQANFIRTFRKSTGLTPGQYRKLVSR